MKGDVVWVLMWHYGDRSATGIVGVYSEEKRAEYEQALLKEHGLGKEFSLGVYPVLS